MIIYDALAGTLLALSRLIDADGSRGERERDAMKAPRADRGRSCPPGQCFVFATPHFLRHECFFFMARLFFAN